jgi:hypothetical protein
VAGNRGGEKNTVQTVRFLQQCEFRAPGSYPSWNFIVNGRWEIIAAATPPNEASEHSDDLCDSDSARHSKRTRPTKRFSGDSEDSSADSMEEGRGQKRKRGPARKKRRGSHGALVSTETIASAPDQDDSQFSGALRLEIEKERTHQRKLELMKSYTGPAVFHHVVTTNMTMEFGPRKEKL